jgi:hypothetical protein
MSKVVVVNPKEPGALWPFVRGLFAWIGLIAVVGVGAVAVDKRPAVHHAAKPLIETAASGWRAYQAQLHKK